jgi:protein-arginine kinase activator protein McsA
MEKIQLQTAFTYVCPNCGKRNFVKGINMEQSKEDEELFKNQINKEGYFVVIPEIVTCYNCKTSFESVDEDNIDDFDYDF